MHGDIMSKEKEYSDEPNHLKLHWANPFSSKNKNKEKPESQEGKKHTNCTCDNQGFGAWSVEWSVVCVCPGCVQCYCGQVHWRECSLDPWDVCLCQRPWALHHIHGWNWCYRSVRRVQWEVVLAKIAQEVKSVLKNWSELVWGERVTACQDETEFPGFFLS